MKIIVEHETGPSYLRYLHVCSVEVPHETAKHIVELCPVLAAATKRPALTLAEVVLTLVETHTGKKEHEGGAT
jgi:hypothetical protein